MFYRTSATLNTMVLTVSELRQLASELGVSLHRKRRKASIIQELRNQVSPMAVAVQHKAIRWQTANLFVRFLSEVYRTHPEDAANELTILAQLSQTNTFISHIAYHLLPKVNRPEVKQVHEYRFREFNPWQRLNALRALIEQCGPECVGLLEEAINDPFEPIQRVSLAQLGRWKPESLTGVAHRILTQNKGMLRRDALEVFTNLPLEQSLAPLFAASFDRKAKIRMVAQKKLRSLEDLGDPFLRACARASVWDPMHIHGVLPVLIARTSRHELPQLQELLEMLAKNCVKKARRILAHAMHNQLLAQRGALLGLIRRRPNPVSEGSDVCITTGVTHSCTNE